MSECLICNNPIEPFIDFGKQPIANGFLTPEQFKDEYFFDMKVAFCPNCYMVQLTEQPDRNKMFHKNYAFYSSTSSHMAKHFEKFAKDVTEKYKPEFVVEIGSNDGIMLRHFTCSRLGIEPSSNVAQVARDNGIQTVSRFFDEKLAQHIVDTNGQADVILAANVLAHISDIHSVIRGVKNLLKPEGVFIFEDPYLGDILSKTSYDQIYDEHAFYFSLGSLTWLFEQHGMTIIDVSPQDVHGGSMRYTVANTGIYQVQDSVHELVEKECEARLYSKETYEQFRFNVEQSRLDLLDALNILKRQGCQVVGYAATAKSATVLNYCGIGSDLIEYICDTTPIKHGKFSPGAHIRVKPYQEFLDNPPDYALLFAWNHTREIMDKEKDYKGKWIVYVPKVRILES